MDLTKSQFKRGVIVLAVVFVPVFVLSFWHSFKAGVSSAGMEIVLSNDAGLDRQLVQVAKQLDYSTDTGFNKLAKAAQNRLELAVQLKRDRLPPDFNEAFQRYLGAWSGFANTLAVHPHVEGAVESFTKNFFRGMTFDFGGAERDSKEWKDWQATLSSGQAEIDRTRTEVKAIAIRHGARPSKME